MYIILNVPNIEQINSHINKYGHEFVFNYHSAYYKKTIEIILLHSDFPRHAEEGYKCFIDNVNFILMTNIL